MPTLTVKFRELEVPIVVCGFATKTEAGPGRAIAAAGMLAVSCVELTKVVGSEVMVNSSLVIRRMLAPLRKPAPLTVRVKPGSPDLALVGDKEVMVGAGLLPLL